MLWNTDFGDLYSDECAMSPLDKRALDIVEQSINLDEGQYTVALPWREEPPPLMNNRAMVEARLRMLRKRLDKNAVMKVMYTDTMRGYIEKGYVRKCPINCDRTSPVNYVVVVIDLPLLRVAVEGSDNPVSLEKPYQASLPPGQQGRHSLGRHPEVHYVA